MGTNYRRRLGGFMVLLAAILALVAPALSQQRPEAPTARRPQGPLTLRQRIATESKLSLEDVDKVLKVLGPAVQDMLARGETVDVTNLGRFRVVRIPQHRDMVNGRPATIPAVNYVEFLPTGGVVDAANAPGAEPVETVPQFEYDPLPNQVKGLKSPNSRVPTTRTR
jgi:nucleoid DNA-binding protein